MPSTLVGRRHPDMALRAAFSTVSIFEACDDMPQTGDAYSAEEKHRAVAVVRIVRASVLQYGVRQLIEDAIPGSGFYLGLSNVICVRVASV